MQMLPSCLLVDLLPCSCTELQLPFGHGRTTAVPSAELCASFPGGALAPATAALEGTQATSDSEGDVYCDTVEQMEPEQVMESGEALESSATPAPCPVLPYLYSTGRSLLSAPPPLPTAVPLLGTSILRAL